MPYYQFQTQGPGYPDLQQVGADVAKGIASLANMQIAARTRSEENYVRLATLESDARKTELESQKLIIEAARDKRRDNMESVKNLVEIQKLQHEQRKSDIETEKLQLELDKSKKADEVMSRLSGVYSSMTASVSPVGMGYFSDLIMSDPEFYLLPPEVKKSVLEKKETAAAAKFTYNDSTSSASDYTSLLKMGKTVDIARALAAHEEAGGSRFDFKNSLGMSTITAAADAIESERKKIGYVSPKASAEISQYRSKMRAVLVKQDRYNELDAMIKRNPSLSTKENREELRELAFALDDARVELGAAEDSIRDLGMDPSEIPISGYSNGIRVSSPSEKMASMNKSQMRYLATVPVGDKRLQAASVVYGAGMQVHENIVRENPIFNPYNKAQRDATMNRFAKTSVDMFLPGAMLGIDKPPAPENAWGTDLVSRGVVAEDTDRVNRNLGDVPAHRRAYYGTVGPTSMPEAFKILEGYHIKESGGESLTPSEKFHKEALEAQLKDVVVYVKPVDISLPSGEKISSVEVAAPGDKGAVPMLGSSMLKNKAATNTPGDRAREVIQAGAEFVDIFAAAAPSELKSYFVSQPRSPGIPGISPKRYFVSSRGVKKKPIYEDPVGTIDNLVDLLFKVDPETYDATMARLSTEGTSSGGLANEFAKTFVSNTATGPYTEEGLKYLYGSRQSINLPGEVPVSSRNEYATPQTLGDRSVDYKKWPRAGTRVVDGLTKAAVGMANSAVNVVESIANEDPGAPDVEYAAESLILFAALSDRAKIEAESAGVSNPSSASVASDAMYNLEFASGLAAIRRYLNSGKLSDALDSKLKEERFASLGLSKNYISNVIDRYLGVGTGMESENSISGLFAIKLERARKAFELSTPATPTAAGGE